MRRRNLLNFSNFEIEKNGFWLQTTHKHIVPTTHLNKIHDYSGIRLNTETTFEVTNIILFNGCNLKWSQCGFIQSFSDSKCCVLFQVSLLVYTRVFFRHQFLDWPISFWFNSLVKWPKDSCHWYSWTCFLSQHTVMNAFELIVCDELHSQKDSG